MPYLCKTSITVHAPLGKITLPDGRVQEGSLSKVLIEGDVVDKISEYQAERVKKGELDNYLVWVDDDEAEKLKVAQAEAEAAEDNSQVVSLKPEDFESDAASASDKEELTKETKATEE